MIRYIKGKIESMLPGQIVLDNNGIGYLINVADTTAVQLSAVDGLVTVYTYMAVKEDDISLYGFVDMASLDMFCKIINVSGIGCKGAMGILSRLSVPELCKAIVFEDADSISKAPGIGKKTAAKLILELKDKVSLSNMPKEVTVTDIKPVKGSNRDEAAKALMALGFSKSEALSFIISITEEDLSTEEYVKRALRSRR